MRFKKIAFLTFLSPLIHSFKCLSNLIRMLLVAERMHFFSSNGVKKVFSFIFVCFIYFHFTPSHATRELPLYLKMNTLVVTNSNLLYFPSIIIINEVHVRSVRCISCIEAHKGVCDCVTDIKR